MRAHVAVLILAGAAAAATAEDHQGCPMMAKAGHRRAEVDHRHEHTTGVPTDGTRHHFVLAEDGGSIRLGVADASQAATRDRIREHLKLIASAFAAGDFRMPTEIHDQVPPGVEVMKARADAIRYAYAESPEGGVVTLSTQDPAALAAIHEFLRFQIRDHGTGDPTR
jgi:hypothetical protein